MSELDDRIEQAFHVPLPAPEAIAAAKAQIVAPRSLVEEDYAEPMVVQCVDCQSEIGEARTPAGARAIFAAHLETCTGQ